MKGRVFGVLLLMLVFMLPKMAEADRRNFVWTYEAKTMAKGEAEIEYYFTTFANKKDTDTDYKLDINHDLEIEYGVTDHFDIAMYQMFRQQEGKSFTYRGYKLRGRYRFGETGQYFVDPLIYIEFIHKPFSHEVEFEEKLVLSKNIGNLIIAFNATFEQEIKHKDNVQEYKFIPTLAIGYQIRPWITVGAEFLGKTQIINPGGYDFTSFMAGPTISLAGKKVWWDVGALFQVTKEYNNQPRFQVRSLLGIFL